MPGVMSDAEWAEHDRLERSVRLGLMRLDALTHTGGDRDDHTSEGSRP